MFIENRSFQTISQSEKKTDNDVSSAIKCICGQIFLLVPNVKLMSNVIETHVEKHKQEAHDPKEAEATAEHIRNNLIIQVFEKASKN